jgi:hypothetical protein
MILDVATMTLSLLRDNYGSSPLVPGQGKAGHRGSSKGVTRSQRDGKGAARLFWQWNTEADRSPIVIGEFIAREAELQFRSQNHAHIDPATANWHFRDCPVVSSVRRNTLSQTQGMECGDGAKIWSRLRCGG